jgi:hypothetical protein
MLLKSIETKKASKEKHRVEIDAIREKIMGDLTKGQKREFQAAIQAQRNMISTIEEEVAKKRGILVSELRAEKEKLRAKEKAKRMREKQLLEGGLEGGKGKPAGKPAPKK